MRLFRKNRDDEPVDPNARSPQLGLKYKDLALLGQLADGGADLTQPRHVVYYCYASSEEAARALGREAEAHGFTTTVREPLPGFAGQWSVVAETHVVTSPEFVRDTSDLFEDLSERYDAEFDGWEASL